MHVVCLWLASTAFKAAMMCTTWSQQISAQRLCFALPQRQEEAVTVYMGVPTMYSYLLAKYDQASEQEQQQAR